MHVNQISTWKRQLLDSAVEVFEAGIDKKKNQGEIIKELHAKIEELTVERDFLSHNLNR